MMRSSEQNKKAIFQVMADTTALGKACWEFPGGPVVRTLSFPCRGHGFDPWSEN